MLHAWNSDISWQQGYAPSNSDRRQGVLSRKRLEYLDSAAQFYDIPDSERSDDEISMLRQVFLSFYQLSSLVPLLRLWTVRNPSFLYLLYFCCLDCCWLPKNCSWCFLLPAWTSSEVIGAYSLYLVRPLHVLLL